MPELARALELGMILRHRRRDDERARAVDVRRVVAGVDADAERARSARARGFASQPVTRDAAPREQLGERAHPGAGDADEVDGPGVGGIEEGHDGGAI